MWSNVDSSVLRVALRIYFLGSLALLGLIGRQCCKLATKIDLLHGRPVPLNRMTGWLRPLDILTCIWKLQAARENALGNPQADRSELVPLAGVPRKEGDLRDWEFAVVDAGNGVARLVRAQGYAPPQVVMEETLYGKN